MRAPKPAPGTPPEQCDISTQPPTSACDQPLAHSFCFVVVWIPIRVWIPIKMTTRTHETHDPGMRKAELRRTSRTVRHSGTGNRPSARTASSRWQAASALARVHSAPAPAPPAAAGAAATGSDAPSQTKMCEPWSSTAAVSAQDLRIGAAPQRTSLWHECAQLANHRVSK